MRRYKTKPIEVMAFQFDPCGAHKCGLPPGVEGKPAPGADNWAYEGCEFWVVVQIGEHLYRQSIKPLDWIVQTDDGHWRGCDQETFADGFEPVEQP